MAQYSKSIYYQGRYYKYASEASTLHILDAETSEALERNSNEFHDHFFKKNNIWYVQSKIDGRHLFEELAPGIRGVHQVEAGEYLDYLFKDLERLG
jgi:hypothetical protein